MALFLSRQSCCCSKLMSLRGNDTKEEEERSEVLIVDVDQRKRYERRRTLGGLQLILGLRIWSWEDLAMEIQAKRTDGEDSELRRRNALIGFAMSLIDGEVRNFYAFWLKVFFLVLVFLIARENLFMGFFYRVGLKCGRISNYMRCLFISRPIMLMTSPWSTFFLFCAI